MKYLLVLLTVCLAVGAEDTARESFRLPRHVVPYHYDVRLLTDLNSDFSFRGQVSIDFTAAEDTSEVVLHSKNLEILENQTSLTELGESETTTQGCEGARRRRRSSDTDGEVTSTEATVSERLKDPSLAVGDGSLPDMNTQPAAVEVPSHPTFNDDRIVFLDENEPSKEPSSTSGPTAADEQKSTEATASSEQSSSTTAASPTSTTSGVENSTTVSSTDAKTQEPPETFTFTIAPMSTAFSLPESDATTAAPSTASSTTESNSPSQPVTHKPESFAYDIQNEFLTIYLREPLTQGKKYRLVLKYRGVLTDTLTGFHRVPYTKKGSQKSTWLASTVFEPSEARTAFPCFDEPDLKATFDVTLGHDTQYTALSNMPLKSTEPIEGMANWQWSTFERTPRMPTYLVAFLISDLEFLMPRPNYTNNERNVTYRFWSRHDVLYKTRYAMRIVPEMKNHLENLLQVKDVLPKHDFIALPSFISTALENWGLYSFAEKNLLFTSGFSSLFSKYQITQVLGHELAHMWFGNMVTPKWWNQVWLSEGFSNFFEIIAADHVQPTWDLKTTSIIFAYLKVFSLDALQSTHPLVQTFQHPNEVNDIFDSISYQKGFYLVRMLNYTLGEESFMNGVRKYLKTNLLSNVDEDDLWDALDEYAHQEGNAPAEYHLRDLMHNWTRKAGYPIVEVTRDYENNTATVTQKRFLRFRGDYELRDNVQTHEDTDTKWWIPLTYTTGSEINFRETKPKLWLNPSVDSVTLTDMPSKNDFVLMNLDAAGLYRVNYDEQNWALLVSYLINENYSEISVLNRVQILDDLLDLARSGDVSYERALDATRYLVREKHFLPWKAVLSNFDFISRMFRGTDANRTLKKFMRNLVMPRFEELGFESAKNESFSDSLNRKQIVKWACKTGLRQCVRKSVSLFKRWMEEKRPDEHNPVPSNLRSVIYCTAIENGGSKEWQFLWQRYLNNALTDKSAIITGLGCSKNARTLKKFLDWSFRETTAIKKQDAAAAFKAVAKNDVGLNLAKSFLREKITFVRHYLGNNPFFLPQVIDTLAAKMNQPNDLKDLEAIERGNFWDHKLAPRCFKQAYERVRFNIDWTERNYIEITQWLKKQKL